MWRCPNCIQRSFPKFSQWEIQKNVKLLCIPFSRYSQLSLRVYFTITL
jgi:hypothetical protein